MASTDTFLTVVKSTNAYVSEFVGSTSDPCFTKGLIESSPTIYKTGNSFFFDYSYTNNIADLKFTKRFFGSLTGGNTFTLSGGTYYIQSTGQQLSFAGTYMLKGVTGLYNQYVNLYGVTYSTSLTDGVYDSTNFSTVPSYSAITGLTAQYFNSKINNTDPYNIEFLGIYGNDYGYDEYLEVQGASANSLRYKINSSLKLNDGSQIVYLNNTNTISNENLYFVPVTVNLYMRGVPDLFTLGQNKNINGLLKIIDSQGNTTKILSNQNVYQRYCRSIVDTTKYYDWFATYKSSNFKNIYNPYAWDGLSITINNYSLVKIGIGLSTVSQLSNQNTIVSSTNTNVLIVDDVQTNYVSYLSTKVISNPSLKIDLSDASLYGATIEPFLDANCSIPLANYYFLNGVPGFDGASFIYLKQLNAPSTIYLKFKRENEMVLQIVI